MAVRRQTVQQEGQAFEGDVRYLHHSDDNRYLVNMHALHNAALIRRTLPRHLVAPTRYFADRKAKHNEFAAALRVSGPQRRAETVAKTKATKATNKQKKNITSDGNAGAGAGAEGLVGTIAPGDSMATAGSSAELSVLGEEGMGEGAGQREGGMAMSNDGDNRSGDDSGEEELEGGGVL